MALLAAMGMLGGQQPWEDGPSGAGQYLLDALAEEVGGQDALDSLDGTPLPDEEFGWDQVPGDVRERVGEVLAACDRCCDDLLAPSTGRRAGGCWPALHRACPACCARQPSLR